ncbi:MAG: ATP-binding cassette domain-containing protein [Kofleriaceae bacterium]
MHIVVEELVKTFRVAERAPGTLGALRGLVRRKERVHRALDGVSFTVSAGELVGYIGPNGAGKSTTIKILAGILVPDGGRVEIDGRVPWRQRVAHVARIGVVFGQRTQLWWDLPLIESLEMLRHIYRVPAPQFRVAFDELSALLELGPFLDTPVRQLSLGQRMRGDLAASLLHAPSILFLDEPTIGLDAVSKLAVRAFVKRQSRERGVTVLLTTHDLDDVEALCDRVIIIGDGAILSDGTLEELRRRVTPERWLTLELLGGAPDDVADPQARVIRREGDRVCLAFDPEEVSPAELIARLTRRHAVRDLLVEHPPIEAVIARMYGDAAGRGR